MDKLINKYIDYLKYEKNYSSYTILNYEEDLNFFKTYIEKEALDFLDIDYQQVRLFFNYLDEFKFKKTTISRKISSVRSFYKFLARNDYIPYNPFELVTSPKKDKKLPKFLYYNELNEIFNIPDINTPLGLRNRLILEILYATGMRVGELENVKISDINFSSNEIKILGKGNKERIVYFDDDTSKIMKDYINKSRKELLKDNNEYLLLNKNGTRLTARGIRLIVDNIIKESSIKTNVSPHTLRHTFATNLLNAGCDIISVQELLGHESLKATQVYTHITDEALRKTYLESMPERKIK